MEIKSSATNITISDMKIMDYDEFNGGAINISTNGTVAIQDIDFHNNSTSTLEMVVQLLMMMQQ